MKPRGHRDKDFTELDELITETTVTAYGNGEKLWAFRQAFEDGVILPVEGFVILFSSCLVDFHN